MPDAPLRDVKTILVASGLAMESAGAVAAARSLAGALGAALHAVYVVEPVSEHAARAVPGLAEAHERHSRGEFEKVAAAQGLGSATLHARRGSPGAEILAVAAQVNADVVVVGRHEQSGRGVRPGRLGTVTQRVLSYSPVSVLIVPPGFGGEFRRAGVATDFSEGSDLAMRRAAALCRSLGIKDLALLHAFQIPPGHHMISSWDDAMKRLTAVSEQLSAEQAARVLGAAGGVRARCAEGDEAEAVARLATEEKLDLLVIATHSRTLAATALLGRTSERIAGRAECAVWAEKSPALVQGLLDAMRQRLA